MGRLKLICNSCGDEVNPKWKNAIEKNECPFCGKEIMDLDLKENLSELREIIDALIDLNQASLDDFLFSNYSYVRPDTEQFVKLTKGVVVGKKETVKIKTSKGEEEVLVQKIQDESQTSKFFVNAGVIKNEDDLNELRDKASKIKKPKKKKLTSALIKSGLISKNDEDVEDEDEEPSEEEEDIDQEDLEAIRYLKSKLSDSESSEYIDENDYSNLLGKSTEKEKLDPIAARQVAYSKTPTKADLQAIERMTNRKTVEDLQFKK